MDGKHSEIFTSAASWLNCYHRSSSITLGVSSYFQGLQRLNVLTAAFLYFHCWEKNSKKKKKRNVECHTAAMHVKAGDVAVT